MRHIYRLIRSTPLSVAFIFVFVVSCETKSESQSPRFASPSELATQITSKEIRQEDSEVLIWNGLMGEYLVKWTNKDLYVFDHEIEQKPVRKLSTFAYEKIKDFSRNSQFVGQGSKKPGAQIVVTAKIMSVFAKVLSIELNWALTGGGGASSTLNSEIVTIDFDRDTVLTDFDRKIRGAFRIHDGSKTDHAGATIRRFFSDADLIKAISNFSDPGAFLKMKSALTLNALVQIAGEPTVGVGEDGLPLFLTEDSLNNFFFSAFDDREIRIRMQIFPQTKMYSVIYLELLLPVSEDLYQKLGNAPPLVYEREFERYSKMPLVIRIEE